MTDRATALAIVFGPTRRYTVALVVTFDPPRRPVAPSGVRPLSLSHAQLSSFHAAIDALPPRTQR